MRFFDAKIWDGERETKLQRRSRIMAHAITKFAQEMGRTWTANGQPTSVTFTVTERLDMRTQPFEPLSEHPKKQKGSVAQ